MSERKALRHLVAVSMVVALFSGGCRRETPGRAESSPASSGSPRANVAASAAPSASGVVPGVLPAGDVVRGVSIYSLAAPFLDQRGRTVRLDATRGSVTAIAMFYATCPHACPRLIANLKNAEAALTPEDRSKLRVVLVTIDPENDTPTALSAVVQRFQLDGERWTLLTGKEDDIRDLAAVLGIKYRDDDGSINHSSVITLLDREGKIDARYDGLTDAREPQSRRVHELMATR